MRALFSTSVPVSVTGKVASSAVVTSCDAATGVSLTGVTVIEMVAGGEAPVPSLAMKVKLSAPLELAAGV